MSTRQRAQRGEDQKEFEGRVRKWKRAWLPAGDPITTKRLAFCKWVPTEERDRAAPGKRFKDIKPLPSPGGKPEPPYFIRAAALLQQRSAPAFAAPMPAMKLKLNTALVKQQQQQ